MGMCKSVMKVQQLDIAMKHSLPSDYQDMISNKELVEGDCEQVQSPKIDIIGVLATNKVPIKGREFVKYDQRNYENKINSIALSPNSRYLVYLDKNALWISRIPKELKFSYHLKKQTQFMEYPLCFSNNSQIVTQKTHSILIYNRQSNKLVRIIKQNYLSLIKYHPNDKEVAILCKQEIRRFDPQTSKQLTTFSLIDHSKNYFKIDYSPDGLILASGSKGVYLWNIQEEEAICKSIQDYRVSSLNYSKDGELICVAYRASYMDQDPFKVYIYAAANLEVINFISDQFWYTQILTDNRYMLSLDVNCKLCILDLENSQNKLIRKYYIVTQLSLSDSVILIAGHHYISIFHLNNILY